MTNQKAKCVLLMSCNRIMLFGDEVPLAPYKTGLHGNGTLLVVSGQDDGSPVRIPDILDLLWDKEVDAAFVYLAGFTPSVEIGKGERKLEMTKAFIKVALDHAEKKNIHLVGCSCLWRQKEHFAEEMRLDLITSECGGGTTLGKIAADIIMKNVRASA